MNKFKADPDKYLPQYGGFDAKQIAGFDDAGGAAKNYSGPLGGVSLGPGVKTKFWAKYKGKLYFFASADNRNTFINLDNTDDTDAIVAKADKKWKDWWGSAVGMFNKDCMVDQFGTDPCIDDDSAQKASTSDSCDNVNYPPKKPTKKPTSQGGSSGNSSGSSGDSSGSSGSGSSGDSGSDSGGGEMDTVYVMVTQTLFTNG